MRHAANVARRWRLTLAAGILATLSACEFRAPESFERRDTKGEPEAGKRLLFAYGCVACHEVPGISGHPGNIGPPLTNWSKRKYIAGNLSYQPDQLVRWLMAPEEVEPDTAMPNLQLTEAEARDMAAYLYEQ